MRYQSFRKQYPLFVYNNYSYKILKNNLNISFSFSIIGKENFSFSPKIIIKNINKTRFLKIQKNVFDNLIFHLGLIEMLSYWKATCSPTIEIQTGYINKNQIAWLKNLILSGMGEFFYKNKIDFQKPNFLNFIVNDKNYFPQDLYRDKLADEILAPFSNGKDSIVTLELLKKTKKNIICFSLRLNDFLSLANKEKKMMGTAKCKNIIIQREIDRTIFSLNKKGFLNGHTPFSAYLAFLSVIIAILYNKKYIVFSNERSANEGNIKYLGTTINHQYSKTFIFEKEFRNYCREYLVKNIEYFSFLRPLYEIQIAKIFSKHPEYFNYFLSCNDSRKIKSKTKKPNGNWCGKCPKCLFIFSVLYPFIDEEKIVEIFKKNLFYDKSLIPLLNQLTDRKKLKPFECVGTKKETIVALYLGIGKSKEPLPPLLNYFYEEILPKYPNLNITANKMLNSWNKKHCLPRKFEKLLKNYVSA